MMARSSNAEHGFIPSHPWGLVTLDNLVGIGEWAARGASYASLERTSAENCARIKDAGLVSRCGICEPQSPKPPTDLSPPVT